MNQRGPPPPFPAGAFRPQQGFVHPGPPGPPGPHHPMQQGPPPGGPPGPPPMQMPMRPRIDSIYVSDLTSTPPVKLDDAACRKRLTTHKVYSIRKVLPTGNEKSTWAKAQHIEEPLSQEDIDAQLKKLRVSPQTVTDKKAALFPYQQSQINNLLDRLNTEEIDPNVFLWSLVQIDRREKTTNKVRETVLITVIVNRTVRDEIPAMAVYDHMQRLKHERAMAMNRPPPPPQPMQENFAPPPPNGPPPQVVNVPQGNVHRPGAPRAQPIHHNDSDSGSDSESDTASSSGSMMSSSATSVSSRSGERSRKYNSRNRRGRSHSRHREHQKEYYNPRRDPSEPPRVVDSREPRPIAAQRQYISEVPISPTAMPTPTPIPAPAETFARGFEAGREVEREKSAQRYLAQRPVIIDEPRALAITGRNEPRYAPVPRYLARRHDEAPMVEPLRYTDPRIRYREPLYEERRFEELYDDDVRSLRSYPRDDVYRRRLSDAEDYIHRDPVMPRITYTGARPQIPHPFMRRGSPPRRYAPSYNSADTW